MFKLVWIIIILCLAISCLAAFEPRFAKDPAISPDGSQVCFVYQGDLWKVPFAGGEAKRLTSTDADEFGPCWSPDGLFIAFSSNRDGQTRVYVMPAGGGNSRLVFQEGMSVCDWFADSKSLLCSKNNLNWGTSLYRVSLESSRPVLIAEIGDYFSSLSPDNSKIIFNRYGDPFRAAYKGSTNGDLWEYDIAKKQYARLTQTDYTERYPHYSYSEDSIYFCASDGVRYQIFSADAGNLNKRKQLTAFDNWSARDISIARENNNLVYELFDAIWCYSPDGALDDKVYKLQIEINEDNWKEFDKEETFSDSFDKFAVSEDDLLLAFSYKYDLFVMPRKGGDVKQVTFNQNGIDNLAFLPDNRTIVFSQFTGGVKTLFTAKVDSVLAVNPLLWYGAGNSNVDGFYKSSDYHWVIEYTDSLGGGRIAVADSSFNEVKPIITDKSVTTEFACSPDGKMAVYATMRDDIFIRELYIYDFLSDTHKKVMNDDSWLYGLQWLPDQKSVLISRSNTQKNISRLDLVPRDEFELETDYWKEILAAAIVKSDSVKAIAKDSTSTPKPKLAKTAKPKLQFTDIDWSQLDKRIFPIVSDPETVYAVKATDDTSFYYLKDIRGKEKKSVLYRVNILGKNSAEVVSFPIDTNYRFVSDKLLYYKDLNRLKAFNLKTKSKTDLSNKFQYEYNLLKLNERVFEQVWGIFGRSFYDPAMHNLDWKSVYARFKPYVQYAETPDVLAAIIDEMIGEVNASHTGYYQRSDNKTPNKQIAQLGMEFNQRKQLVRGREITRIYPGSRLYNNFGIRDGDVLLSINGTVLTSSVPMDSLLIDKTDKKLDLVFLRENKEIKAIIKGLSWSAQRELWFQDRNERRKKTADTLSNNRIGYVLIPRMGDSEYSNFIRDLFKDNADKEALIIDIRGNGGGHIHEDLLSFLENKPSAFNTNRFYGAKKRETPRRTWTKPIVLLIDENSFSDAEIFPQLFKEAKLGKVIGMPTSGSVIGTWEEDLIDGSSMRMPGSGWYRLDGTNMEGNGAQPDIKVEMSLNDIINENDLQLKKAVEALLEQLK
jgi:tricorn protease